MSALSRSSLIEARFRVERDDFALDVELDLPASGITALFGHSGSGKTTCLRAMAGLERAPTGRFVLAGEVWQDESAGLFLPTHQRSLGYVFQEASLFPHLTVLKNMTYGQKRVARKNPQATSLLNLDQVTELLGIGHLLDRAPLSLSGGERQRVAIARALLTSPKLLLMDEPLAALDLKRKQEILPYLERLHDELSIPVIYVSHAPDEVARLADHLVLLEEGRVIASGPLADTLARTDLPPAFADNTGVVLQTVLSRHEADHLSRLEFEGGAILVAQRAEAIGSRLRCRIHARDVSLTRHRPLSSSILNILPATVTAIVPADTLGHVLVQLTLGETKLLARITERSRRDLLLEVGQPVWGQIKAVALLA